MLQLTTLHFTECFPCSFSCHGCGQLARETAYCGSSSLQSDRTLHSSAVQRVGLCGWVCENTRGGAHHGAGDAPSCPYRTVATYVTTPLIFFPFLTLFLPSFFFLFLLPRFVPVRRQIFLKHAIMLVNAEQTKASYLTVAAAARRMPKQGKKKKALTVTLWF